VNITPLDIRKQEFRKVFRGYDPAEVEAFLDMVADAFEKVSRDTITLQERVEALDTEIGRFRNLERTLQETLIAAQQAAEDTRENAKKEGDLIVKEAEIVAERAIEQARGQVSRIKAEIVSLKTQRDTFLARFKGLLEAQSEFLKDVRFDDPRETRSERAPSSQEREADESSFVTQNEEVTPSAQARAGRGA
jgi:cell division initiation protein